MSDGDTAPSGRVLAIDLGRVRIGLAISDPLGWTAQPLDTLAAAGPREDCAAIEAIVDEHEVTTVVVGWPRLMSGEEGRAGVSARKFAERLGRRRPGLTVDLWDERLTSVEAERTMVSGGARRARRRGAVDRLAALLILQGYLDQRRGSGA